jgi:hypothetical protein
LQYKWRFQITSPWSVPTAEIREYFGEKVALYFTFLSFYTKNLLFIGLLGFATWVVQYVYEDDSSEDVYFSMLFGYIKNLWTS